MTTDQSVPVDAAQTPTQSPAGIGRIAGGLALSILSAVMVWVSFPDRGGLYPLLLVAFVPMYVAAYRVLPRRLSAIPIFIVGSVYWFIIWSTAWGLLDGYHWVIFAIGIFFGLSCVLFGIFDRKFSERTGYKWFVVQLPLWWVAVDIIFQENLWDGTNGWLAYRFAGATPFIQPVSIVSTPVLTFLILMFNAGLALLVLKWIDTRWPLLSAVHVPRKIVVWSSVATFGFAAIWVASSLYIYTSLNAQLADADTVRVAAIQPSNSHMPATSFSGGQPIPTPAEDDVRRGLQQAELVRLTKEAVAQGAVMSVWPEETLNYDPRGPRGTWVSDLARETRTTIVTGFLGETPIAWPSRKAPNMSAVFGPTGELAGVTYKIHPVLAADEEWGGTTPQIFPTFNMPFGQLGVIICFDHDFPNSSARLQTLTGSQILANPAWDWSSISSVRWQSVVFRSVENRIPIVKGETGFDAVITDANGMVLERTDDKTENGEVNVLVADVHLSPRDAPFTQLGGMWFGVLVLIAAVARYGWQVALWWRGR